MDSRTGQVYSEAEMAQMSPEERKHLVEMTGDPPDIQRISRAVKMAYNGNLTPKEIRQGAKDARRAKNRVARKSRKNNRRRDK